MRSTREFKVELDNTPDWFDNHSMETLLKYLHELIMFAAVAVSMGSSIYLRRVAASGHVPTIHRLFTTAQPFLTAIAPLYGIGTLLGLAAAWVAGFPLLALWLVLAYALTIAAAILGQFSERWALRVTQLAGGETGDSPGPELAKVLQNGFVGSIFWIDVALIAVFVALMVFRPS